MEKIKRKSVVYPSHGAYQADFKFVNNEVTKA